YGWQLLERLVARMKEVASDHGAKFMVFSASCCEAERRFCLRHHYFDTDGKRDFVTLKGKQQTVDFKRPLKNLGQVCSRLEIPFIKPVREYDRYATDIHTNKLGNLRMAEDIVDFLLTHETLDRRAGPDSP